MNLRTKKQEHTSLSLRFSVLAVVAVARRGGGGRRGVAARPVTLVHYTHSRCAAQCSDGALYLTYRWIHSRIHFYSVLTKNHGNFKQKTRQITPFTSCPNCSNSFYRSVWFLRLTIVFSTSILGSKGNGRRRGGRLLGAACSQDAAAAGARLCSGRCMHGSRRPDRPNVALTAEFTYYSTM